jgi:hypothetical protein
VIDDCFCDRLPTPHVEHFPSSRLTDRPKDWEWKFEEDTIGSCAGLRPRFDLIIILENIYLFDRAVSLSSSCPDVKCRASNNFWEEKQEIRITREDTTLTGTTQKFFEVVEKSSVDDRK